MQENGTHGDSTSMVIESPILVTGSHRSGSTWTGKMLAKAPNTAYVHEPFNFFIKTGMKPGVFQDYFTCVAEQNEQAYLNHVKRCFAYRYPGFLNLLHTRTIDDLLRVCRDQSLYTLYRMQGRRAVVKDPIAVFSAEWLAKTFQMRVLVLIRHPAAFCSSIKKKGWSFDFGTFRSQPLLMEKYLLEFESQIDRATQEELDLLDQAILLWNCFHHAIKIYQQNQSDWLFVKHEDLSADPIHRFHEVFDSLDLDFTDRVRSAIMKSSGTHNPVEQKPGDEFKRNSKQNIRNWKSRLSDQEIIRIREGTADVACNFYSEEDW